MSGQHVKYQPDVTERFHGVIVAQSDELADLICDDAGWAALRCTAPG